MESGVLQKKHCNAFIFVTKRITSMGYMENADIREMAKHSFWKVPMATTGRYTPFKYITPFLVFSALFTSIIFPDVGSVIPMGGCEKVSIRMYMAQRIWASVTFQNGLILVVYHRRSGMQECTLQNC